MKKILYSIFVIIMGFCLIIFLWKNFGKNNNFEIISEKNLVKIIAKNQNNEKISESFGWKIGDNMVLTALHNVENEQYLYTINNENYAIFEKNTENDLAIIVSKNFSKNISETQRKEIFQKILSNGSIGEQVYAYVWRDDAVHMLTGEIITQDALVFGLEAGGIMKKIFVKNLTNLNTQKGDSGTAILTKDGRIVDVVHIAK